MFPSSQDGDEVGERQRLFLVVGHEHDGRAEGCQQLLDLGAQAVAQARVERGERLVEQDQARLAEPAPGPRRRAAAGRPRARGAGDGRGRRARSARAARSPAARRRLPPGQPEADVLGDAEVGEEQALLGHVADAPAVRRDVVLAVVERSPLSAIRPRSGWSKPAIRRSSVVLPDPEGPSTAAKPPAGTVRSTSLSTAVEP